MRDHPSEAEASPSNPLPRGISPEAVRAELASVLSSGIFSSATRSSRFLHYVVEATLAGQTAEITVSFRFRDRAAPAATGTSSFPWLNTVNLTDLVEDFRHAHH